MLESEGGELGGVELEAALQSSGAEPKELGNYSSSSSRRHKDSAPDYHAPNKGDGIEDRHEYWEDVDSAQAKETVNKYGLKESREAKGLTSEPRGAK